MRWDRSRDLPICDAAAASFMIGPTIVTRNIISIAVTGDFLGWSESLQFFAGDALFGLVILFLIKKLTDAILAPGIRLGDEQIEEKPNVGAGLLEAFGYVGGSMLIVWVF